MGSGREDNWSDFPWLLSEGVNWQKVSEPGVIRYRAWVRASDWKIRLNDFPSEPLFTLLINGEEVIHFTDWPNHWSPQPV